MRQMRAESGFSLIELIVATAVLLIVSSIVTGALLQMTNSQRTIWNRTQMHSGIRGATELLQQEVGQAGRVSTPTTITLEPATQRGRRCGPGPVSATCDPEFPGRMATVQVGSVLGLFASSTQGHAELLTTLDGENPKSVPVAAIKRRQSRRSRPASQSACIRHCAGRRSAASPRASSRRLASERIERPCSRCMATSTPTATWCTRQYWRRRGGQTVSECDGVRRREQADAGRFADPAEQHHREPGWIALLHPIRRRRRLIVHGPTSRSS